MAQVTLEGPDGDNKLPNTGSESKENGWSFKKTIASLNTMLAEIYAALTAAGESAASSSPTKFVDVTVTSAQVLALFATPVTIVPAPGAGLSLLLESVVVVKPAGTAYGGIAAGEDLAVKFTDAAGAALATIETTGFLDQATAQVRQAEAYRAASGVNSSTPTNAPLVLHLLVGEITTGTSDLKLRVFYRVIPTTLA